MATLEDILGPQPVEPVPQKSTLTKLVDEVRYGAGQVGAGFTEYFTASPEAIDDLGERFGPVGSAVGAVVPNFVWGLTGLVQNALPNSDPSVGPMSYVRSGADVANDVGTAIAGQQIDDPKNYIDVALREVPLLAFPFKPKALEAGAGTWESIKYLGKSIALPGMQSTTKGGMAAETFAATAIGDVMMEMFDDDTNIDDPSRIPDYKNMFDTAQQLFESDMFPNVNKKLPTIDYFLGTPSYNLDQIVAPTLDGTFPEGTEEDDDSWSYASKIGATIGGLMLAATGKAGAAKILGTRRMQRANSYSEFMTDTDAVRQMNLETRDAGKKIVASLREGHEGLIDSITAKPGLRSMRETKHIGNTLKDFYEMLKTQVLDSYALLRGDINRALADPNSPMDAARAERLNTLIDTVANEGAMSEIIQARAKSGFLPFTTIRMKSTLASIMDRVSLLKPELYAELKDRLIKRTVLSDMGRYNASADVLSGKKPAVDTWGNGTNQWTKAELDADLRVPPTKEVAKLIDDIDDMMRKIAEWHYKMGNIDEPTYSSWKHRQYVPLRYGKNNALGSTDMLSDRNLFDNGITAGIEPENIANPIDMLPEYFDASLRNGLKNKVNRDLMQVELEMGYRTRNGDPMVRFANGSDDSNHTVTVNSHDKPLIDADGNQRKGAVKLYIADPIRKQVIEDLPMLARSMYSAFDTWRRISQQMTTGLGAPYFIARSMMYETASALSFHPKGRNLATGGRAISRLTNKAWDLPDPSVLAAAPQGMVAALYSDMMISGVRRLNSYLRMRDVMQSPLVTELFGDKAGKMMARPVDRALFSLFNDDQLRRIVSKMERAYLNSGKYIKESLGGGTAANFADSWDQVTSLAKDLSATYTGSIGDFDLRSSGAFRFLTALNDAAHSSVKVNFINSNKHLIVRQGNISGNPVPMVGTAQFSGYHPDLHNMVKDARNLTGNVLRKGGVRGTAVGEWFAMIRDTTTYMNVGTQVLARTAQQFYERPYYTISVLTTLGMGYLAYITNEIIGNPEREKVYLEKFGPSARSAAFPLFDDNNNLVMGFDIPHEMRMFISPIIEGYLAALGKGSSAVEANDQESYLRDAAQRAFKVFWQDVNPWAIPQPLRAGFSALTGQRAPEIGIGRLQATEIRGSKSFTENPDVSFWKDRAQLVIDELFMSAGIMFTGSMQAAHEAFNRGDTKLDTERLIEDIQTSFSANFRKDQNLTSKLFNLEDRIPRTVTSFDDHRSQLWHDTNDKIKTWSTAAQDQVFPWSLGGSAGAGNSKIIRGQDGQPIRRGRMTPEEQALAIDLNAISKDPQLQWYQERMSGLLAQKDSVQRQFSDPVTERAALNQVELERKELLAEAMLYIQDIEEMLRQNHPAVFNTFDELSVPQTPYFDEEGVGKVDRKAFLSPKGVN